jgi:plasmid stabilization system protein ParE
MGCKIIFSAQAIADLEQVVRHIANDDPVAAMHVGNRLIDRVEILENFPLLGAPYRRCAGVRKLISPPYVIFYRPRLEENSVDILCYWHGARPDPDLESPV